jgi:hypothetical protein
MDSHSHVSPGETCSDCGMHRKIMDSIPARPLTRSEVEALGDGDGVEFVSPINLMAGEAFPSFDDSSWRTEDIVVATESGARVISLHQETGWVVDMEQPLECECCTAREHGMNLLFDATEMLQHGIEDAMGDDPILNDESMVRWPAEDMGMTHN